MKQTWVIYKTWKVDEPEKYYIGVTNVEKHHNGYKGSGNYLKRAFKKYGKKNFLSKILLIVKTEQEAYSYEKLLAPFENLPHYNLIEGGRGGRRMTEKTKAKLKKIKTGNVASIETKQKMSLKKKGVNNPMYGKIRPDLTQYNKTKDKTGDLNGFHGKKHSEESRKKISKAMKGRVPWNKGKRKARLT